MEISAGLLIIKNNKILLAHPTKAPWYGTYTIPKGKIEKDESYIEAALRETKEEIGIEIKEEDIKNINKPKTIKYTNEKGEVYKILKYFIVEPSEEIKIDKSKLDKNEVNWAGFLDIHDSMCRIFWRYEEMLKYIK
ncbi:MAG: NUDIX hydrolase [bacterium]